jgi:hypothetical protein
MKDSSSPFRLSGEDAGELAATHQRVPQASRPYTTDTTYWAYTTYETIPFN